MVDMAESSSDYRKAYETVKRELADLLSQQEYIEKRLVVVRQSIRTLQSLCESEGVAIRPSPEAITLLEEYLLADEIRNVLKARYPCALRPHEIKGELERLGHDLSSYQNPQATIHMVLKRMTESESRKEVEEQTSEESGKKAYRWIRRFPRLKLRANNARTRVFLAKVR